MMHRRNNSQGDSPSNGGGGPLEETSHNRQQQQVFQTEKHLVSRDSLAGMFFSSDNYSATPAGKTKTMASPLTLTTGHSNMTKENDQIASSTPPSSPSKKYGSRTATNLVGLLSRPKSTKTLDKMAKDAAEADGKDDDDDRGRGRSRSDEKKRGKSRLGFRDNRNKESQTAQVQAPLASKNTAASSMPSQVTPIYAQFCTMGKAAGTSDLGNKSLPSVDDAILYGKTNQQPPALKPRPKSFHPVSTAKERPSLVTAFSSTRQTRHAGSTTPSSSNTRPEDEASSPFEPVINPDDIDTHLEALLDRRNIPEHQRYKMRNLANSIKMELIRQDWAEERSKRQQQAAERPQSHHSVRAASGVSDPSPTRQTFNPARVGEASSGKSSKSKHSRIKSLTLSKVTRGRSRDRDGGEIENGKRSRGPGSPLKKKAEGTLGRHFMAKSTESFINVVGLANNSDTATSPTIGSNNNPITGFFAKARGPQQNSPADFVTYLRTVQAPEKVEVGKLHKLRLLLRNETVAWIEDFIGQGGMEEVVGLLHRIMAVEWR